MIGAIVAWSGAIVDIPIGWQMCDGTNGTPDLRGRNIIGAGGAFNVDDFGGSSSHNHDVELGDHDHEFSGDGHDHDAKNVDFCAGAGPNTVWLGDGLNHSTEENSAHGTTDGTGIDGTTGNASTRSPYWALAWIQKMS